MNKEICGCGECSECEALTKLIIENQTPKERAFDRAMDRRPLSGDSDEDDESGGGEG